MSDLAIIGIYYFQDGEYLKRELQYLLDNDIKEKGEYQLTNALENMKAKGTKFVPGKVSEWLDCGNKDATVYTNQRILEFNRDNKHLVSESVQLINSQIIPPCYIGENVVLTNSVIGPYVSLGDNTKVNDSKIKNTIVQTNAKIKKADLSNSMLGNFVEYSGTSSNASIGDYTTLTAE